MKVFFCVYIYIVASTALWIVISNWILTADQPLTLHNRASAFSDCSVDTDHT